MMKIYRTAYTCRVKISTPIYWPYAPLGTVREYDDDDDDDCTS